MHGSATEHAFDFGRAPRRIYWEVTRACSLACRHCRAEAAPHRAKEELDTEEGFRLLEQLAAGDPKPHVVLTGGDPLERPDLFELGRGQPLHRTRGPHRHEDGSLDLAVRRGQTSRARAIGPRVNPKLKIFRRRLHRDRRV